MRRATQSLVTVNGICQCTSMSRFLNFPAAVNGPRVHVRVEGMPFLVTVLFFVLHADLTAISGIVSS